MLNKVLLFFLLGLCVAQPNTQSGDSSIDLLNNDYYKVVIGSNLSLKIQSFDNSSSSKIIAYSNSLSYALGKNDQEITKFYIANSSRRKGKTIYGNSEIIRLKCFDPGGELSYNIEVIIPDRFKSVLIFNCRLINISPDKLYVSGIVNCDLTSNAKDLGAKDVFDFWSFQPESTPERQNWIKPLTNNFYQKNYQGMNASDYGGGIPVLDIWTKSQGIAIASLSMHPEFISLPVQTISEEVNFDLEDSVGVTLYSQEEYSFQPFAIILHKGDFFNALRTYSNLLQMNGFKFPQSQDNTLETEWCAWGYERDFNVKQILRSLDYVVSLGMKWVTIDDGWQSADGDWNVSKQKFKNGDKDFIALVDSIHSKGLKARLWWVPLTASDSLYNSEHYPERLDEFGMKVQSNLANNHPDWFVLNQDGNRYQVSWWNSYQLCPALEDVIEYYKSFVRKAILEWGIDGFKIDGQNFNLIPPCYNSAHNHKSPLESSEATPLFFKAIYETAKNLKPDFLIQICPCGTNYSVYNLPFVDQVVASDPMSSEQVRIKGKTFKALFGNKIAYSGDHVELTNRKWDDKKGKFVVYKDEDFASMIGIGGVPSTKFTSPHAVQVDSSLMLTAEKKNVWKKWMDLYAEIKLSEGEYLNLYDIAFDKPETHVIKKDNTLYYSLFADSFNGTFEFRGLKPNVRYKVREMISGNYLGEVNKNSPRMELNFNSYLILKTSQVK
jgi:alpha-galactosidase